MMMIKTLYAVEDTCTWLARSNCTAGRNTEITEKYWKILKDTEKYWKILWNIEKNWKIRRRKMPRTTCTWLARSKCSSQVEPALRDWQMTGGGGKKLRRISASNNFSIFHPQNTDYLVFLSRDPESEILSWFSVLPKCQYYCQYQWQFQNSFNFNHLHKLQVFPHVWPVFLFQREIVESFRSTEIFCRTSDK